MPSTKTATNDYRGAGVTAAAWRVRAVNVLPDYRLSITCNDGTNGIVDMSALVNSPDAGIYAELKDAQLFQRVSIELHAHLAERRRPRSAVDV